MRPPGHDRPCRRGWSAGHAGPGLVLARGRRAASSAASSCASRPCCPWTGPAVARDLLLTADGPDQGLEGGRAKIPASPQMRSAPKRSASRRSGQAASLPVPPNWRVTCGSSIARAGGNSCRRTWPPFRRDQASRRAGPPQPWVLPRSLRRARRSLHIVGGRTPESAPACWRWVSGHPRSEKGVSVYEQNLVAAKRASRRLDEHGRRLERFSNQPTSYAWRRSGGYPRVGAWPPAGNATAAPGGRHLSLPGDLGSYSTVSPSHRVVTSSATTDGTGGLTDAVALLALASRTLDETPHLITARERPGS